jgi:tetratricopeptide (TPR) repeat protein
MKRVIKTSILLAALLPLSFSEAGADVTPVPSERAEEKAPQRVAQPEGSSGKTAIESPASSFREAGALYAQEKYKEAVALYRSILKHGRESSSLYYNLGNAYFKLGNLGRAVVNYRRAWDLSPRDPEINKNLEYAQECLEDDISALSPNFLKRMKFVVVRQLPLGSWFRLSSSIYFLTALWIILVMLIKPLRKISPPVLKTLLVILALSLLASFLAYSYYRVPRAVVLDPEVSLRYGPDEKDAVAFQLHEGTEVRLIRKKDGWSQISLPDGKSGWLPSDSLEII